MHADGFIYILGWVLPVLYGGLFSVSTALLFDICSGDLNGIDKAFVAIWWVPFGLFYLGCILMFILYGYSEGFGEVFIFVCIYYLLISLFGWHGPIHIDFRIDNPLCIIINVILTIIVIGIVVLFLPLIIIAVAFISDAQNYREYYYNI
eukprot:375058_1